MAGEDMQAAILKMPPTAWTPAYDGDGQVRDGAWVADITGLLNLGGWPAGMRVIVRKERPHPGAGDGHADGVVQPPRRGRQPFEEPVGGAVGVRADQGLAPQAPGQLRQGQPGGFDEVGGGVRPGVPRAQRRAGRQARAPQSARQLLFLPHSYHGERPTQDPSRVGRIVG
jgi:hypothetical protein